VDPTAPIRLAYANATGVWIQTFDPATHAKTGAPVLVSDRLGQNVVAQDLTFSPQGRYLAWEQYGGPDGLAFGLYDGETGRHVTGASHIPLGGGGGLTAVGTGLAVASGNAVTLHTLAGDTTSVPIGFLAKSTPALGDGPGAYHVAGAFPGGFLLANDDGTKTVLYSVRAVDGTYRKLATLPGIYSGGTVAPDGQAAFYSEVDPKDPLSPCGPTSTTTWYVHDDQNHETAEAAFTNHVGWTTADLSIAADGTVGGVLETCPSGTGSLTAREFVELHGSIATVVARGVQAARRGPGGLLATSAVASWVGTVADGDRTVAELGTGVSGFAWAPEHRP
jgi:hypothetical protein